MDRTKTLSLLRNIYRELRPLLSAGQHGTDPSASIIGHNTDPVWKTPTWKYIRQTTSKSSSSNDTELVNLQHFGQIYLSYLRSSRQYLQLLNDYKGKGERSILDTATMVGFKLPESSDAEPENYTSAVKGKKGS